MKSCEQQDHVWKEVEPEKDGDRKGVCIVCYATKTATTLPGMVVLVTEKYKATDGEDRYNLLMAKQGDGDVEMNGLDKEAYDLHVDIFLRAFNAKETQ